jgi:organic hydroperoxide reductase OsmC/OhrA
MQHSYAVTVTWTGNLGEGTRHYRGYSRNHSVATAGRPDLLGSSDPTFHGDRDRWNPEQLMVAALSQCHMLSFLHVCVNDGVVVTGYVDEASGHMTTDPDGSGRFTQVLLRPRVTVAEPGMVAAAQHAHGRAHRLCFIANSVSFPVRHEPETSVG